MNSDAIDFFEKYKNKFELKGGDFLYFYQLIIDSYNNEEVTSLKKKIQTLYESNPKYLKESLNADLAARTLTREQLDQLINLYNEIAPARKQIRVNAQTQCASKAKKK